MDPEKLRKRWPKIEQNLQVGDILLFQKRRGPLSGLIRKKLDSHWNHSALVFHTMDEYQIGSPLIVEAVGQGIEIHQLKRYSDNWDNYDIGVKRFPKLTEKQKNNLVVNFVLNNVDVPYDYGRLVGFLFLGWLKPIIKTELFNRLTKNLLHEDQYICSTFVNKTFQTFSNHELKVTQVDPRFKHIEAKYIYSPGDIALDDTYKWIFNKQ